MNSNQAAGQLAEATKILLKKEPRLLDFSTKPLLGIVLGSGLGDLADAIETPTCIPYGDVPGLPTSTASGHRGQFIIGSLAGTPVIAMAGRLHAYEGHTLATLTTPIALMCSVGAKAIVVSCAAGAINPTYQTGDLVLLDEQISWLHGKMGAQPPWGRNGPAQRTLSTCSASLAEIAWKTSHQESLGLRRGMYLAMNGPNYETRTECRMLRTLGVDLVGMSTVAELHTAAGMGVPTIGFGVVTNVAIPDAPVVADHTEVLEVCSKSGFRLQQIVHAIAAEMSSPTGIGSQTGIGSPGTSC